MKTAKGVRRVAVIGNPNTGKTTLFNALTGMTQRVGNYPGVTVEKKTGTLSPGIELIDLPGTYSLAAFSPDEMVAVNVLLGKQEGAPEVDLVLVVVDAGNLSRNLYLVTQIMELGLPTMIALNMVDSAEKAGVTVDHEGLAKSLGLPVVPTIATKKSGVAALESAIEAHLDAVPPITTWEWPEVIDREVETLASDLGVRPFVVRRALVDAGGSTEEALIARFADGVAGRLEEARARVKEQAGAPPSALEARMRYAFIGSAAAPFVTREEKGRSMTDRLDAILTHRLIGTLIFVLIMTTMFISIFLGAAPLMDLVSGVFDGLGGWVSGLFAGTAAEGGILESLLVDGVITGVGGVLVFLPQIIILFLFIALLEDCGYLSRAAFLMDRLLRFCGLSGHSFIPMLSSFACAVPGVMATRTIGDRRERLATILVAPLMSCSARIPIYALLIAAFVPATVVAGFLPLQGLVFTAMYFVGILVAIPVAIIVKKLLLKGPPSAFVMELPPYRTPSLRTVTHRVYDRAKSFVKRAGTVIFAMSIVVWALGTFPRDTQVIERAELDRVTAANSLAGEVLATRLADIDNIESGDLLRNSALGTMGRAVEPLVEPLGWDWRIGMAAIASFPAREVVVSTLAVIFDLGGNVEDESGLIGPLKGAKRKDGSKLFTLPVALSVMIFFALCAQCMATLAVIRRETNSWRWPLFTFGYMTVLAWVGALVAFQVGTALGW